MTLSAQVLRTLLKINSVPACPFSVSLSGLRAFCVCSQSATVRNLSSPRTLKHSAVQTKSSCGPGPLFGNADGWFGAPLNGIPLRMLLLLRQNARMFYMSCPNMKAIQLSLRVVTEIKRDRFWKVLLQTTPAA